MTSETKKEIQNETIRDGTFLCFACLTRKPLDDISRDPRYCQGCCEFLLEEAKSYGTGRPAWIPRLKKRKSGNGKKIAHGLSAEDALSGADAPKMPVKKIKQGNRTRGRPVTLVPDEFLNRAKTDKLTSRAAAALYLKETGITVSHVTFSKLLNGQGVLV